MDPDTQASTVSSSTDSPLLNIQKKAPKKLQSTQESSSEEEEVEVIKILKFTKKKL